MGQCVKSQMKRESIFIVIYLKHAVLMSEETEPHLVQTEDGDYLALTGQPKKLEEDLKLEEAGTDYSEDYGEDYEDDYEEEEQEGDEKELKQRGELTEEDVDEMFKGADMDYSVDHQDDDDDDDDDDDETVEWEEILIKEEPKPKVAGATMRFG